MGTGHELTEPRTYPGFFKEVGGGRRGGVKVCQTKGTHSPPAVGFSLKKSDKRGEGFTGTSGPPPPPWLRPWAERSLGDAKFKCVFG